VLALVFSMFAFVGAGAENGKSILLTFTGDCTLGSEDRLQEKSYSFHTYISQYGYGYPFAKTKQLFEQDDLTIVNLENVFYDAETGKAKKTYNFRGPSDYVRILTEGSVEVAFLGNNHILDYGKAGADSTIQALETHGIAWFGTNEGLNSVHIYEKDGIRIGFIGGYASHWIINREDLTASMEELNRAGCNAIVAVMHGGAEYSVMRDKYQQRMASWLARNGADVIIGHHPHVVQGMDIIEDVSVIYSLGNFSFGGNRELRAQYALVARVELRFDEHLVYQGHQINLIPVSPSGTPEINNYQPVILSGQAALKTMALAQRDTAFRLAPYLEGIGALQPFIPAVQTEQSVETDPETRYGAGFQTFRHSGHITK